MDNPNAEVASTKPDNDLRNGLIFALSANFIWGFLPLLLKAIQDVSPVELIANRVVWSIPIAFVILFFLKRTGDILPTFKDLKKLSLLALSALIITANWGVYVWAVVSDHIVEAALGYFINPLVIVALGGIFLGERFQRLQLVALALATVAVILLTVMNGVFPWISAVLAVSFAFYALIRKQIDVGPAQGFFIEILLISIFAIPYMLWLSSTGDAVFGSSSRDTWLLLACGPATALPLIFYASGAKLLPLSTVGILQYLTPSIQFLIGVFYFMEPFSQWQLVAFLMIWTSLAIYTYSMLKPQRATS
ncbi:MAG: EamA family transporter RarD [Rhizobiaceae bacterium]|nr:EamA family transporter RarD [Rhizobiaceae bacterium]